MSPNAAQLAERTLDRRIARRGLRPRDAGLLIATIWTIAVVVFGIIERLIDPRTFHSVWLGMWWAIETITTVGYGDIVPDQTAGKLVAGLLMVGGLSLLSVVTATITSGFVARAQEQRMARGDDPLMQRFDQLTAQVQALTTEIERLRDPEAGR